MLNEFNLVMIYRYQLHIIFEPCLYWKCENLEEIAVVIIINENIEFFDNVQIFCDIDWR